MPKSFIKLLEGYQNFREKYVHGDQSIMQNLSYHGQQPQTMVVACCDSRVDPALILQCNPGDLFVVRNVANIVPPYEKDEMHHGTSAALEFGIRFLKVKNLILLAHSQCGGIQALLNNNTDANSNSNSNKNDFINNWVSIIKTNNIHQYADNHEHQVDEYAKLALSQSYQNCLTFPWIREKIEEKELLIHLWFFDIKMGQIFTYSDVKKEYQPLSD